MIKKKTKTPQQIKEALRKRCVEKAKEISKIRDGYLCRYCGEGRPHKQVHSHHIFHEGLNVSMSADPDNLITMCARHHATGQWNHTRGFNMHATPTEAGEWLRNEIPELYQELLERSRVTVVCDLQYWQKKMEELKEILNNLY